MARIFVLIAFAFAVNSSSAQKLWTLQDCIDKAFQNNIQLQQSELNITLAELDKRESVGRTLPSLNGSATHGYNWGQRIDPFTNTFATQRIRSNSLGINSSVSLFTGLQNYNTIQLSELNVQARQADQEAAENDVALSVASAYLTVLFSKELLNIAESNLASTNEQVDRIAKMVDAGQLPEGNLSDILAQQALDEANVTSSQNNLDLAYLTLAQLILLSPDEYAGFEVADPPLEELEASGLPSDPNAALSYALSNFPQMVGARLNVESAVKGVQVAQGNLSPRLSASYSYGSGYSGAALVGVGTPQLIDVPLGLDPETGEIIWDTQTVYTEFDTKPFGDQIQENVNSSLFFSLQIPIFNGFSTQSTIERAEVNLKSAQLAEESTKLALEQDIQRAYADAKAAYNNFLAGEKSVSASQQAFDYAQVRFDEGVINLVDYNIAKVRLDNSKADWLRNKYDYLFRLKIMEFYQGKALTLR